MRASGLNWLFYWVGYFDGQLLFNQKESNRAKNYWGNTASDIAERNNDKDASSLLQG